MKTILKLTALSAVLLGLAGGFSACEKPQKAPPFLTVDETPIVVGQEIGEFSITVESNGDWTAIIENAEYFDWITLDISTGSGTGTITGNVDRMTHGTTRRARINVTLDSLVRSIIIEQFRIYFEIDHSYVHATAETGSHRIARVRTSSDIDELTVSVEDADNHTWCIATMCNFNSMVCIDLAENTTSLERTAVLKVSWRGFTENIIVTQHPYGNDVSFTEYALEGTSCKWKRFDLNPCGLTELIIINSNEELKNYIDCNGNFDYPEIDFSLNTLLLARTSTCHGSSVNHTSFQQISAQKYIMVVTLTHYLSANIQYLQSPIIVAKIADSDEVILISNTY